MKSYDVVIIGGGMAGLSAGLYAVRAKLKTVLLEKMMLGGQIVNTEMIENYPGFQDGVRGIDLIMNTEAQASKFGLETAYAEVMGIDATKHPFVIDTGEEPYTARAIIIASGGEHNKLGVPGEAEFEGKGVSYCATCDGNFFTDQDVVVVGGGDAAMDDGLYLTNIVKSVTVVHRRSKLRASKILQERAFNNPKMKFIWDTAVESIKGNGKVESVNLHNVKTNATTAMPINGVFVHIGFHPCCPIFKGTVEMDEGGHIITNIHMETSVPGIFAAGDARANSARQLATAAGDGVTAAIRAYHFVSEGPGAK